MSLDEPGFNKEEYLGGYYLFIPYKGPLIDPDKVTSFQVTEAKSLRGKVIKRFIQIVESVENFLEPN